MADITVSGLSAATAAEVSVSSKFIINVLDNGEYKTKNIELGVLVCALPNDSIPLTKVSSATSVGHNHVITSVSGVTFGSIVGRLSGGTGAAENRFLSGFLDIFSTTQGAIIFRNATSWAALAPGTSTQFLQTGGASNNPAWVSVEAVGGGASNAVSLSFTSFTDLSAVEVQTAIQQLAAQRTSIGHNHIITSVSGVGFGQIVGRITGGTGAAENRYLSNFLDIYSTTQGALVYRGATSWAAMSPGTSGTFLRSNGASQNPSWVSVEATGGSSDVLGITSTHDPSSPFTPTSATGNHIEKITGWGGAKVINLPAGGATSGERTVRVIEILASATVSLGWGAGVSIGLGVAPTSVIMPNTTGRIELYTDNAWTSAFFDGDIEASAWPTKASLAPGDFIIISDVSDSGRYKKVPPVSVANFSGVTKNAIFYVPVSSATSLELLVLENFSVGTVQAMLQRVDAGALTTTWTIADKTGATDWTPTGAANITGLVSVSVSTTPFRTSASGGNTMAKEGTTDRILRLVVTSVSGSPTLLTVEMQYLT